MHTSVHLCDIFISKTSPPRVESIHIIRRHHCLAEQNVSKTSKDLRTYPNHKIRPPNHHWQNAKTLPSMAPKPWPPPPPPKSRGGMSTFTSSTKGVKYHLCNATSLRLGFSCGFQAVWGRWWDSYRKKNMVINPHNFHAGKKRSSKKSRVFATLFVGYIQVSVKESAQDHHFQVKLGTSPYLISHHIQLHWWP